VKRATKDSLAGRRYLDLQREAKRTGRPTDELIQLYALECFLDRLVNSEFANNFILKGGVLLAALDARRPTRDIDFAALNLENAAEAVLSPVRKIASISLEDGIKFDPDGASAEAIREEDSYSGIRVTLRGTLSRAVIRLHVDVNVGDPIWPEPQQISLPRLIDGVIIVRGYPLEMVLAEKVVTALARGTVNTRWRDFVDIYVLTKRYSLDASTLISSIQRVARFRNVALTPLRSALAGYAAIAQPRWLAWLRKQKLDDWIPTDFSIVLERVVSFADLLLVQETDQSKWDPVLARWVKVSRK
jgi:predicted nucleotidyltransferase component of viral defense system